MKSEALTRQVIGCFFTAYNELGFGLPENLYTGALEVLFRGIGLNARREHVVDVMFRGTRVGSCRMDFLERADQETWGSGRSSLFRSFRVFFFWPTSAGWNERKRPRILVISPFRRSVHLGSPVLPPIPEQAAVSRPIAYSAGRDCA